MSFNRAGRVFIIIAVCLVSAACAASSQVSGIIAAQAPDLSNETREGRRGDLIAIQRYEPLVSVQVEVGADNRVGLGTNNGFDAGDQFYLATTNGGIPFFCRVMHEPRIANALLLIRSRPCLLDSDADNRFDSLWTMFEVGYNLRVDGGEINEQVEDLDPPIPYRRAAPMDSSIAEHGLWLRRGPLGGWFVLAAIRGVDGNLVEFGRPVDLPAAEALPAEISVMGTTLEILGYDEGAVRYRVVSQPPKGTQSSVYRVVTTTYVYY